MGNYPSMNLEFLVVNDGSSYSVNSYFQSQLADGIPIQSNLNITFHGSKDIFNVLRNLIVNVCR